MASKKLIAKILQSGQRVVFPKLSGNDDGNLYEIQSHELHNEVVFYRLKGLEGSLFLRNSLATTRRKQ